MGKTVVVSSHILMELAELCDSVGIIEKGRLVASGRLEELSRQARLGRKLRLKVISDPSQAETILGDQPGVSQVYEANGYLEVEFLGEDAAAADLLATLVARGVRIISFGEVSGGLEEVFLRLTKGEVT
jgi:ABC-2 type transport system ATP-binding protein